MYWNWLIDQQTQRETRMTDKICEVVWVGGKRSSTRKSCSCHKRFQRETDAPELGVCVIQSQRPTVALAACQHGEIRCLFVNHSLLTQTVI